MHLNTLAYIGNENRIAPAPINDMCKRVRFRQSECRDCVDICPVDAISLPFGPAIGEACTNCGLCQIICPMEAFEGTRNTDQMILELLHDQADSIIEDQTLHIHCHQAEADGVNSVAVNCAGNVTENALTGMADVDVKTLMLTTGKCSACQLNQGIEMFDKAVTTYSKLSGMLSRPVISMTIRENEKHKSTRLSSVELASTESTPATSRREFFRSLGNGVTKQAAKAVVDKEQKIKSLLQNDEDRIKDKRPSPHREMLRTLLRKHINNNLDITVAGDLAYKKMTVDVPHCVGCGVCVSVCPTGALIKEVDGLELIRTINFSLCTNCGVCAEACPQDVIGFEQKYSLGDLVNDTEQVVARVTLNACLICGEIIPVSEGEVCTTCHKRQVVPVFM